MPHDAPPAALGWRCETAPAMANMQREFRRIARLIFEPRLGFAPNEE
jgi:hypothetical protein